MKVLQLFSLVRFTPPEYIRSATDNAALTHTHTHMQKEHRSRMSSQQTTFARTTPHTFTIPADRVVCSNSPIPRVHTSLARSLGSRSISLTLSFEAKSHTNDIPAPFIRIYTEGDHNAAYCLLVVHRTSHAPAPTPLRTVCVCSQLHSPDACWCAHGRKIPVEENIYLYVCVLSTQNVRLHRLREADACDCDCQITFNRTRDTQPSKNSFSPTDARAHVYLRWVLFGCVSSGR